MPPGHLLGKLVFAVGIGIGVLALLSRRSGVGGKAYIALALAGGAIAAGNLQWIVPMPVAGAFLADGVSLFLSVGGLVQMSRLWAER